MESMESVKHAIHDEPKWKRHHPYPAPHHYYPHHQHHHHPNQAHRGKERNHKHKGQKNQKNNDNEGDETKGRKGGKQPKVIPDQTELDAELEAYNKARSKKPKNTQADDTVDPLTEKAEN